MERERIWETLTGIFQDVFEDDDIELKAETTAEDIEDWDSLTHIQLMVAIEQAFQMRFNTGEVAKLANVGEMIDMIAARSAG